LPRGLYLERAIESFNVAQQEALRAVAIGFPAVYDGARADLAELTQGYERSGRVFHLGGTDANLRLSYAADPGLLSWLKGRVLRANGLPFAITSPTQIFRRHRSGELGPLNRIHQFTLSDLHILAHPQHAEASAIELMTVDMAALCAWVPRNEIALFFDVTEDFWAEHAAFIMRMVRQLGVYCVVNWLPKQKRYYRMRGGLVLYNGTGALMLFNIQWDEENAARFNISVDDGARPVIIHGNSLAGSGLMDMVLGRALAGLAPRIVPAELDLVTTVLIPMKPEMVAPAERHAKRLRSKGFRVSVDLPAARGIGSAVGKVRGQWMASYAVIGPKDAERDQLDLTLVETDQTLPEDALMEEWGPRFAMCSGRTNTVARQMPFS
jgi:threonyl-tRNA synthetase